MPAYRIGERELRSFGIPIPEEPPRKRTGTARERRAKKVAKRYAGRAVPEDVDDADHAAARDVPDAVGEDAMEEMAAEDGPEGATAAGDVSEDAAEGASEKQDKETDAFIAIINMTLLVPHVKVYYTPELHAAGISDAAYCYEYLVYGPIGFPTYHCVELVDMSKQNFEVIRGLFFPKSATTSKNTATFFRRPKDGRPDIVIAMTAAFLVLQDRWEEWEVLSDSNWVLVQTHLAEEFKAVRLPAFRPDAAGPANPNTNTTNLPKLR
ncbi:hypothetical protein DL768_009939 [Monosporascus sp. mg162]|nr:hypothetical protein DL768_009939 [Monosporascus sp. mg162]